MRNILGQIFWGESEIREYVSIALNDHIEEQVLLKIGENWQDISGSHWILCLDPVVYGVWLEKMEWPMALGSESEFLIEFRDTAHKPQGKQPVIVSTIRLEWLGKIDESAGSLHLLKLKNCTIGQFSDLKSLMMYRIFYKKPGFSYEKFKSYVSAFSYPRKVRIISCGREQGYNIFPMDFVGEIRGGQYFVFGLRHSNRSLPAILESGEMAVSEIPSSKKHVVNRLGKHHSEPLPAPDCLGFRTVGTSRFGFLVPEWAEIYREVKITKTMNLGSHMMLWGEMISRRQLHAPTDHLFHIHFLHYLHQIERGLALRVIR